MMGSGILLMMIFHWSIYFIVIPVGGVGYSLTYFNFMPEILQQSKKTLYASFVFVMTFGMNTIFWKFMFDIIFPLVS